MKKKVIGFIIHPVSFEMLKEEGQKYYKMSDLDFKNNTKNYSTFVTREKFSNRKPHVLFKVKDFKSPLGRMIDIVVIVLPLFPSQIISFKENKIIEKIIECVELAKKHRAEIVGLGGFSSVVGDEGRIVAGKVNIAITSGNSYTASLCIEGIQKAAAFFGVKLNQSTLSIIGATGDIGRICSKVFSKKVKKMVLCSRTIAKEKKFINLIKKGSVAKIFTSNNIGESVKISNIVLLATSSILPLVEGKDFKNSMIICDVSIPPNISRAHIFKKAGVFVFDGGKSKHLFSLPIKNLKWNYFSNNNNSIYGCLAETITLGFEGRFENFSIGRGKITEKKIGLISSMAKKHGFQLSNFSFNGLVYDQKTMLRIKRSF